MFPFVLIQCTSITFIYIFIHSYIYVFTLLLLPFSLFLLYHLDTVPDQDSGARTRPWLFVSCVKNWSPPHLPSGQLHQKGVDRMCLCCYRKGKTSLCAAPQCLSTEIPQGVNQIVWVQEFIFIFTSSVQCSSCARVAHNQPLLGSHNKLQPHARGRLV